MRMHNGNLTNLFLKIKFKKGFSVKTPLGGMTIDKKGLQAKGVLGSATIDKKGFVSKGVLGSASATKKGVRVKTLIGGVSITDKGFNLTMNTPFNMASGGLSIGPGGVK
eukprot:2847552-Prymnesium_polylepis.2